MLKKCQQFIHDNLLSVDTNTDDYYFSELRQFECLKSILKNLECAKLKFDSLEILAKYLRDALTDIDELYGKHDDDDKLEIIFNKFCIGKQVFHVKHNSKFDVIVVGGGHAGIEAAVMSSRLGAKTAIVTFDKKDIGTLSCNPAMGGLGLSLIHI